MRKTVKKPVKKEKSFKLLSPRLGCLWSALENCTTIYGNFRICFDRLAEFFNVGSFSNYRSDYHYWFEISNKETKDSVEFTIIDGFNIKVGNELILMYEFTVNWALRKGLQLNTPYCAKLIYQKKSKQGN
jgi:hypothetical protein